jgi:serine/threonine protein kinase
MSNEPRRLAGRYELEDRIGRGGMGEVWRATDTVLGRQVAVKTIDLRTVPDDSGAARFEREARVTAGMSHPNIVTVHDSGVEGDTAYLVMELLPGPSLADRLREEGPLPLEEVEEVGRQVAVKTIDLRTVPDDSGAARFEREARVTAGMSHPNIVTVHDSGVEGDTAYLVMELLPGPSLADRLREEGPLPLEEVEEVGRQVAAALDAAHARGLVHRDIKPANIVYAGDGRVRVLDFGITQLGDATGPQALTATHTVMGTAEYLAPEQAVGGRVDGRADLYALGCVLYALLAGAPPFRGPTPVATMMMHANDPVPDVAQVRPETPPWLAGLVTGLLAKDADARPAGAASVVTAFERHEAPGGAAATTVLPPEDAIRQMGTAPPPVPAPPPGQQEQNRSSAPMWVLVAVAVLALALLGWWAWSSRSQPAPEPTTTSTVTTTASPSSTPTTPEPTTSTPKPTTSTPAPPTADPTQAASDALTAFSGQVTALEQAGTLDKDAAKTLDAPMRDLEKALRDGDPGAASTATEALTQAYDAGVQDASIGSDAAAALDPLLADLQDAVDAYSA